MSDWKAQIDILLESAPDRYDVGEDDYRSEVAREVEHLIPDHELRPLAALGATRSRQETRVRQTNRLLREIFEVGQFPLGWLDLLNHPLAVQDEHVALRACMPEDFENFANEERRRAANDFAQRNHTCEGAIWIAERMRGNGWTFGREVNLEDLQVTP